MLLVCIQYISNPCGLLYFQRGLREWLNCGPGGQFKSKIKTTFIAASIMSISVEICAEGKFQLCDPF